MARLSGLFGLSGGRTTTRPSNTFEMNEDERQSTCERVVKIPRGALVTGPSVQLVTDHQDCYICKDLINHNHNHIEIL